MYYPFIDTHAHLYDAAYAEDLDTVLEMAVEKGLVQAYLPNLSLETIEPMLAVERRYPKLCKSMLGLHPCEVKADFRSKLATMKSWLEKHPFVGIGEVGLDLYWDKTYYQEQIEALQVAIGWAKAYQLPLALHARSAIDETIQIVQKAQDGSLRGVFHAFTGTVDQAHAVAKLGFYIGIGGIVTFSNSHLPVVVQHIDLSHIVLETDSPYLTPTPNRGKRNQPSYLAMIVASIAQIKDMPAEVVAHRTTENAQALFAAK